MEKINNLNELADVLYIKTKESLDGKRMTVEFSADQIIELIDVIHKISHDSIEKGQELISVSKDILKSDIDSESKNDIYNRLDSVIEYLAKM